MSCILNLAGIDVDYNGKIKGIINSPVFWEKSSRSFPYDVFLTDKIKKAINYSYLIEAVKTSDIYLDTIFTTPYFVQTGKSQLINFSGKYAKFVYYDNYTFYDTIKQRKLNDIDIDWWQPLNDTRLQTEYDDFVFAPIKNESAGEKFPYDIVLGNPDNMVNFNSADVYINGDDFVFEWWSGDNYKNVFQPIYKSHAFVRKIFEYFGYTVTVNHLKTYKQLEKACFYSNFIPYIYELAPNYRIGTEPILFSFATIEGSMAILVEPDPPFEIPAVGTIVRLKKNSSDTVAPTGTVTEHVEYNGKTYIRVSITTAELGSNYHLYYKYIESVYAHIKPYDTPYQKTWPDWTIEKTLVEIQKNCGVYYSINDVSKTVEIHAFKKLLNNTNVIDLTGFSSKCKKITQNEYNGFELKFKVDDTDEEMSANYQEVDTDLIGETVASFSNLPATAEKGEIRFVEDERKHYQYNVHINPFYQGWTEFSKEIIYKTGGDNPYVHEIEIAPLVQAFGQVGSYTPIWRIKYCLVNQPLNIHFEDVTNSPLRIFYFFGDQDMYDMNGVFPCSSIDNINHRGLEMEGYYVDLTRLYGDKSIYKYFLKEYIEWIVYRRKDCQFEIDWPKNMLVTLPFFETFRIHSNNYIIKSIEYEIDFGKNTVKFPTTEMSKI